MGVACGTMRWPDETLGRDLNDMPQGIAVMVVIVAVGLAVDRLVFSPIEWWVRHRWGLSQA